jgi:hypothetical protein
MAARNRDLFSIKTDVMLFKCMYYQYCTIFVM